eukprot:TRINITY_DN1149_c0_g2_i1.p1 TRINITY_DN1149_c0_g2~~TRINITY_DN1149_c0_g2_i1.p1  ORF type:complete len:1493 (+),score=418.02 TRINITY_DN1149_c0_g2_i1:126-4481(+)
MAAARGELPPRPSSALPAGRSASSGAVAPRPASAAARRGDGRPPPLAPLAVSAPPGGLGPPPPVPAPFAPPVVHPPLPSAKDRMLAHVGDVGAVAYCGSPTGLPEAHLRYIQPRTRARRLGSVPEGLVQELGDGGISEEAVRLAASRWHDAVTCAELSLETLRDGAVQAEAYAARGSAEAWLVAAEDVSVEHRRRPRSAIGGRELVSVVSRSTLTELDVSMQQLKREQLSSVARGRLEVAAARARLAEAEQCADTATRVAAGRAQRAAGLLFVRTAVLAISSLNSEWRRWAERTRRRRLRLLWREDAAARLVLRSARLLLHRYWVRLGVRRIRRQRARTMAPMLLCHSEQLLRLRTFRRVRYVAGWRQRLRSATVRAWGLLALITQRRQIACFRRWSIFAVQRREFQRLRKAQQGMVAELGRQIMRRATLRYYVALHAHERWRKRAKQGVRRAMAAEHAAKQGVRRRYLLLLHRWGSRQGRLRRLRQRASWLASLCSSGLRRAAWSRWMLFFRRRRQLARHRAVAECLLLLTDKGLMRRSVVKLVKHARWSRAQRIRQQRGELLGRITDNGVRASYWRKMERFRIWRRRHHHQGHLACALRVNTERWAMHRIFERLRYNARQIRRGRRREGATSRVRAITCLDLLRRRWDVLHCTALAARMRRRHAACVASLQGSVARSVRAHALTVWQRCALLGGRSKAANRAAGSLQQAAEVFLRAARWGAWRLFASGARQQRMYDMATARVALGLTVAVDRQLRIKTFSRLKSWAAERVRARHKGTIALQKFAKAQKGLMSTYWAKFVLLWQQRKRRRRARRHCAMLLRLHCLAVRHRGWHALQANAIGALTRERARLFQRLGELDQKIYSLRCRLEFEGRIAQAKLVAAGQERDGRTAVLTAEGVSRTTLWLAKLEMRPQDLTEAIADLEMYELVCRQRLAQQLAAELEAALDGRAPPQPQPETPRSRAACVPVPGTASAHTNFMVMMRCFDWARGRGRALRDTQRRAAATAEEERLRVAEQAEERRVRALHQERERVEKVLTSRISVQERQLNVMRDKILADAPSELLQAINREIANERKMRMAIAAEQLRQLRRMRRMLLRLEKPFGLAGSLGLGCVSNGLRVSVSEVTPGGPAARGLVSVGDVIVAVRNPKGLFPVRTKREMLAAIGPEGHVFKGVTVGLVLRGRGFGGADQEVRIEVGKNSDGARAHRLRVLAAAKRPLFGAGFNAAAVYDLCCDPERCRGLLRVAFAVADTADTGRVTQAQWVTCCSCLAQELGCPVPALSRVVDVFAEADTDKVGALEFDRLFLYLRELFLEVIFGDGTMADDVPTDAAPAAAAAAASVSTAQSLPPPPAQQQPRASVADEVRRRPSAARKASRRSTLVRPLTAPPLVSTTSESPPRRRGAPRPNWSAIVADSGPTSAAATVAARSAARRGSVHRAGGDPPPVRRLPSRRH